jgi:hypothetical protein
MPPEEELKGGLIPVADEPFQQLAVTDAAWIRAGRKPAHLAEDSEQRVVGHAWESPSLASLE